MSNYFSCSGFGVSYKIYCLGSCVFSLHYHFWFLFFCFGFLVSVFYWQSYYCFSSNSFLPLLLESVKFSFLLWVHLQTVTLQLKALLFVAALHVTCRVTLKWEARDCSQPTSSIACISSLLYTWDAFFYLQFIFLPFICQS